ncbi:MAG: alanyl-tRNA editing protein [Thermoplasmata archaeon]
MTRALYLDDAYLREFDATVTGTEAEGLLLDATAFYPSGGGQPHDEGTLSATDGRQWRIADVQKGEGGIVHRVGESPLPRLGEIVHGELDWTTRYRHMRYHTALHILSGAVFHRFGSTITGGQISQDRARMDFSLPDFGHALAESLLADANRVVEAGRRVLVRYVSRAEADADPSLVRVARELLPTTERVRLIDIEGFDVQLDGGTHVRSTREVGSLHLERIENKGARNKRMYIEIGPPPT